MDIESTLRFLASTARRMWIDSPGTLIWESDDGVQHRLVYDDTPRMARFLRQSGWQGGASSVMSRQYYWNPAKMTGFANISRPQNPIEVENYTQGGSDV